MRIESALANRLGNRSINQDRCDIVERDAAVLCVLADGMGGHPRGELAAEVVVEHLRECFARATLPVEAPREFLDQALAGAHKRIGDVGRQQRPAVDPRTTVVACLIQQGHAVWAHVGDSRLYWLRAGTIRQRTFDHTYVEELHRCQVITSEEMQSHPLKNYVTRCLGGRHGAPEITVSDPVALQPKDLLMLCSDGLWGAVSERDIIKELFTNPAATAAERLAQQAEANAYPHSDNISVVVLNVADPGEEKDIVSHTAEKKAAPAEAAEDDDQLDDAIRNIHRALKQFGHELDE